MIIWSQTAISHITEFIDEAKAGTEYNAKKYINKLINYVDILNVLPNIGKKIDSKINNYDIKQLIYKKHRILYCKKNTDIVILAIIHTNLDLNSVINRLIHSS